MSILKKIFGKHDLKQASEAPEEVNLHALEKWLDEKTALQGKEFDKRLMSKFVEIKQTMHELQQNLNDLSEKEISTEEGNKRLRKIVDTSKQSMLRSMQALLEKLAPPQTQDYRAISAYCTNASALLQAEISNFGKNIAYTGLLLKAEIKQLGELINALSKEFTELQQIFAESHVMYILQTKEKINEIESEISNKQAMQNSLPKIEQEVALLEASRLDAIKNLNALKISLDYQELQELLNERNKLFEVKQQSKEKIVQLLAPIEKPMKKLQNLVSNRQFALSSQQEENALNQYLQNPLLAIAHDNNAAILKSLIDAVIQAINSNLIEFKDKDKRLSAISELLEGEALQKEFKHYLDLSERIAITEKRLQESSISKRISDAESDIRQIGRNIQEMNDALAREQKRLLEKEQKIAEMLQQISGAASKATALNVRVIA